MASTSSTSSSSGAGREPGSGGHGPARMLMLALASVALLEVCVLAARPFYLDAVPYLYLAKGRAAARGEAVDLMILGDSQATVALRPASLQPLLPEGVRIYNYGMIGSGPSGGEVILHRYLEHHEEPPAVVALLYMPMSMNDVPGGWVNDRQVVSFLFGAGDALRNAVRARDVTIAWDWLTSRLPSLRYRNSLKSGMASLALDHLPWLRGPVLRATALTAWPSRFHWLYRERAERNRAMREELGRERGWRFMADTALEGGVLPERLKIGAPPFVPHEGERLALRALLERLREVGARVVLMPNPMPRAIEEQYTESGSRERVREYWREVLADFPELEAPEPWLVGMPHGRFSDPVHLNREGVEDFVRSQAPRLRQALEAASR